MSYRAFFRTKFFLNFSFAYHFFRYPITDNTYLGKALLLVKPHRFIILSCAVGFPFKNVLLYNFFQKKEMNTTV